MSDEDLQPDSRQVLYIFPKYQADLYKCQPTRLVGGRDPGGYSGSGRWSKTESRLPINVLELRAICLALLPFHSQVHKKHVLVQTDNISAKTYREVLGPSRFARKLSNP